MILNTTTMPNCNNYQNVNNHNIIFELLRIIILILHYYNHNVVILLHYMKSDSSL